MKEFKGTKGEWEIDKSSNEECVISIDSGVCGNIICEAPTYWPDSIKNWEANAKLIASAPELLKALSKIADMLDSEEMNVRSQEFKMWEIANEAINKALID